MKTKHGTFFAVLAMAAMFAACGNPAGGGDSVVTALDLTDFVARPVARAAAACG